MGYGDGMLSCMCITAINLTSLHSHVGNSCYKNTVAPTGDQRVAPTTTPLVTYEIQGNERNYPLQMQTCWQESSVRPHYTQSTLST